jgi:hypothetical protein
MEARRQIRLLDVRVRYFLRTTEMFFVTLPSRMVAAPIGFTAIYWSLTKSAA